MKKQPKIPKPTSQLPKPERNMTFTEASAAERRQLQDSLKRYNCTIDEQLSQKVRTQGILEGKTVCSLVSKAVQEYLEKRQAENQSS